MKFITEEDLRDLYKKQPFTDYDLKEGERLTPGARQFLVDRGVDMYDRNDPMAVLDAQKKDKVKAAQAAKTGILFRMQEWEKALQQNESAAVSFPPDSKRPAGYGSVPFSAADGALPAVCRTRKCIRGKM